MGGGNDGADDAIRHGDGLSPRGRGKRGDAGQPYLCAGSIPAWAGETFSVSMQRYLMRVYPRVGGGNGSRSALDKTREGLSPRGRGKPFQCGEGVYGQRSIPAWAGETRLSAPPLARSQVYPRVGGGNGRRSAAMCVLRGLSPRGRGKRIRQIEQFPAIGSIPAWAGETTKAALPTSRMRVYPRVGGGNYGGCHRRPCRQGLSPRGRGKPRCCR